LAKLTSNVRRVRKSVKDTQGRYSLRTRNLARKMGAAGRENVRDNIAPKASGGVFPGYAMTGALRKKVVASAPVREGKSWTVKVRVLQTGKQKLYARIHETGGTIRAKRAPYLTFKIKGQWVRVKSVVIKAKGYFSKGIERTRRQWNIKRLKKEF